MDGDDALAAFTRDFAATQASDAYSNATFVLSLTGLFATLNQVVAHLVTEHVVHGARACFAPHAAWGGLEPWYAASLQPDWLAALAS